MSVDREKLAVIAAPRRSALVVIDMQNDFCEPADFPDSVPMLPRLERLIAEARRSGVRVIFTRVTHDETTDSAVWLTRRAPGRKDIVRAGTPGADYHPGFQPQPGDLDIEKHRYSAFIGTPLEMNLRALNVETLLMTGIATNVCVESTLRDAFQRDFHVVLVDDCCAAASSALHQGTVENVRRQFGGLIASSGDLIESWTASTVRA